MLKRVIFWGPFKGIAAGTKLRQYSLGIRIFSWLPDRSPKNYATSVLIHQARHKKQSSTRMVMDLE